MSIALGHGAPHRAEIAPAPHLAWSRQGRDRFPLARVSLPVLLCFFLAHAAAAADWPHWRGPGYDGSAPSGGAFAGPTLRLELEWSRTLGAGYSGISIAEGRAVTMYSDGAEDRLVALDAATGETIWTHAVGPAFPAGHGSEGGPASTPTIEAGVVYALDPAGNLVAVRLADGSEIWRLPLVARLGLTVPEPGLPTSPLVVGDRLFVETGSGGTSLAAVDKASGAIVWTAGDDSAEYVSPIPAELAGVAQILTVTDHAVTAFDPVTGASLWSAPGNQGQNIVPTPVLLGEDRILLPGWWRSTALRVGRTDSGFEAHKLWETTDLKGTFATPVLHQGNLYGYSGEFLTCISASDGARRWKSRIPGGNGLILVDGHLVIFGKGGTVVVALASPQGYSEAARIDVFDSEGRTYPSFADGRIFVRNTRSIAAVRVAGEEALSGHVGRVRELARIAWLRTMRGFRDAGSWVWNRAIPTVFPHARHPQGPGDEPGSAAAAGSP